jgi:hypothetical protein
VEPAAVGELVRLVLGLGRKRSVEPTLRGAVMV